VSGAERQAQGKAEAGAAESLLEAAIGATKQTERSEAEDLLRALTGEAMKGQIKWAKSLTNTVNKAIAAIDARISEQLAAVMHHEKFRQLEGSWRGLHHLVMNSETSATLKIKMLNVSKDALFKDLDKAVEFDQSQVFKKIYESEFGHAGGEPYANLIGDYQITNHPDDIELLAKMSQVSGAAFAPFITSPAPSLLGFGSWEELPKVRDLEKIFESPAYTKWRSFRDSDDSRFVCLTMPRSLARLPYGKATKPVEEFAYEEVGDGKVANDDYCWMNAAYVYGTRLTDAFAQHGWCVAIRGAEGGGKVEGLPTHNFKSDDGDLDTKCPTEVGITDRREAELSKLGFLPLCHYKNTDYAVFFGAQTAQKPKKYDKPAATANAAISARMPYIMATSRISHFLKVIGRDKIGSFMEAKDCQALLNNWIQNYVNVNADAGPELKAKKPLADAKIEVKEIPGAPGSYQAVAWLRPWMQLEELTTSLRMVASIPGKGG
jgi:type VI secretion system protein ImpC